MKIAFDFDTNDCVAKALKQVLGGNEAPIGEADVVLTESVNKVLHHLQNTDNKVVQFSFGCHYPMTHLIEDYPDRLRVVEAEKVPNMLVATVEAIKQICE